MADPSTPLDDENFERVLQALLPQPQGVRMFRISMRSLEAGRGLSQRDFWTATSQDIPEDSRQASDYEIALVNYFTLGNQYYVVARFSAFAGFIPVCGNLFHHAVEMYLKGALSSTITSADLRRLAHKLKRIWKQFKMHRPDPVLSDFDQLIAELDKFEVIRYPDRIISEGIQGTISFADRRRGPETSKIAQEVPSYTIEVRDIDRLILTIFEKSSVSPKLLSYALNEHALSYLNKENLATLAN